MSAALILLWVMNVHALTVSHLRVDAVSNPMGVDESPRFSWMIESDERGCVQVQYRICIYQGDSDGALVYDSGETSSSRSTHVTADGFSLQPQKRYYWRVWVKDNKGNEATSTEQAYFESGLVGSGWNGAQWIKSNSTEGVPRFRKKIVLTKDVKSAWLYTTALGIYDLEINGQRVGHIAPDGEMTFEELKPGWTDYRKTVNYSTHNVTSYMMQGNNVIGATVTGGWWSGNISVGYYGNKPVAFLAKLVITYEDNSQDIIVTDQSWSVNNDGSLRLGDIWNGEDYDATKEDGWTISDVNSNLWTPCDLSTDFSGEIVSVIGSEVWTLPEFKLQMKSVNIYEGSESTRTNYGMVNSVAQYSGQAAFTLKRGQTAVVDFGQNMVGWTPFTIKGKRGSRMRLRYAEMLNDNGSKGRGNDGPGGSIYLENLRAAQATLYYTFRGDSEGESYCPFSTYFGFRYCEITADDDIEVGEIYGLPVSSQTEDTGDIRTDNSLVNQLISNIQWGQRGNLVSIPTDCPQRSERYGWTGDTQAFSRTGMYNASTEAFYRNYMSELRLGQNEDGAYPHICPVVYDWYGSAGWSDAGIIIPYNHYLMFADKDLLRQQFPSMEKYMDWLASRKEGGWKYPGGDVSYGDWLAFDKCNNRYASVAYYANNALLMSKMAQFLSENDNDEYAHKAKGYQRLYDNIKDEFNLRFWNFQPKERKQANYVLPLAFDLLEGEKKDLARVSLQKAIKNNKGLLSTGFLGTSLFLPTLSRCELANEAYNLLLQRGNPSWLYSIDQGATTIWERWDSYTKEKGFGPADMNSFNHYAYGAVGEWMYRYMAGIDTDDENPGFCHILLKPELDLRRKFPKGQERICEVSASYLSCQGMIISEWKMSEEGETEYKCSVPANSQATLYLPISAFGDDILEGNVKAEDAEGVEYIGLIDGKHIYQLTSGNYHFYGALSDKSILHYESPQKPITINKENGQIRVESEFVESISIFDVKGRLLSYSIGKDTMNISQLRHGVYIVYVLSDEGSNSVKFVK
ncbi:MAG: family 78 glycoside hydrolase catalytic domain [Prevotella sp.]|nr:family 78 glycoside hydrolase catalytic domain [Prevotella sp.]